jgi:hypothetical protein
MFIIAYRLFFWTAVFAIQFFVWLKKKILMDIFVTDRDVTLPFLY